MVIQGGLESHRATSISSVYYIPDYLQPEEERLLMQKVTDIGISQPAVRARFRGTASFGLLGRSCNVRV